ncbi:enoyl-CoA hydratase/isomerase family protein [Pseudactinotalea sp. HY158]|uniref:enoyl-CoA hydratase/isomerase family protein n=1 Tax=Pseudactinotalea sp. HY158 TaxID=2654547 RepID=UPI00129C7229|nr:enoyl-CoA hydratase/isomerase family protein [Pseudactinotalea sp. HY158]QGH68231.1 enoyl-CoA hydratase/isomerase family protein [Pseudactinotalea sp. HY158]
MTGDGDVLHWTEGHLGRIRLNRPRALNAVSSAMVEEVSAALARFDADDRVRAVALDGAGERGLCAGADVRSIRAGALDGSADPVAFWEREYALIRSLLTPATPLVAFMDGIVMGAGVGLSAYAGLRLVTGRTRLAMPETGIGLFPDVGTLFPLSRAPGEIGTHLAMTGEVATGADAIALGLADALVPASIWDDVCARLAGGAAVAQVRAELVSAEPSEPSEPSESSEPAALSEPSEPSEPGAAAPLVEATWIGECYRGGDPVAIRDRLRSHPHPGARAAAEVLDTRSPLSVAVALAALRRAAHCRGVEGVIERDLRIARALMDRPDFNEGVRALLVDKDRAPRWEHADLAEVDPALVAGIVGP